MNKLYSFFLLSSLFLATACTDTQQNQTGTAAAGSPADTTVRDAPPAPDWAKNATIYEVNTRQFSPQGNFKAIEAQLPRLKEMGVDIVWLMPIYPISQENKQGTLGSPYAIADYKAVNPAYGTLTDFKSLVNRAHELGLRIMLDWVANHTGRDHAWVTEHPDWYIRKNAQMVAPIDPQTGKPTNWNDVYALDFNNPAMRRA